MSTQAEQNKSHETKKKRKVHRKRRAINFKRVLIIFAFTFYAGVQLASVFQETKLISGSIGLNELYKLIEDDEVENIIVSKSKSDMTIIKKDGTSVKAVNPQNDEFIYDLMKRGVVIQVQNKSMFDAITNVVVTVPMILIMAMIAVYLTNTILGASTKMFTVLNNKSNNVTFDDIRGLSETKKEVQFIINQLKEPDKIKEAGGRVCKGVLFYGPPGTGKTMMAKAIAKEAGVAFISASGSDFSEMFVGVGAGRVRHLWELAVTNAPCIIFIDEIDCLGKRRSSGDAATADNNQTLNALLQKMDGLNESYDVMVIGATNRKEDLDSALLRPGRFDKHYYIGEPNNKKDRDEVVEVYTRDKKLYDGVTLDKVSKLLIGLTGAEIEEAMNEAVHLSMMDNRDGVIKLSDVDEAVMQLRLSGVKKEHSSERDLEISAVHEAGHTIVSLVLGLEISKVSIIPYSSGVGGITVRDIDKTSDMKLKFKEDYDNDIMVALAGKVAEELVLGQHSQGCSNDLEKATEIIYNMITNWGFDNYRILNQNVLIKNGLKNSIESDIINECNKLLNTYNNKVVNMLKENMSAMTKLRDMLLTEKTIVEPTLEMLSNTESKLNNIEEKQ